MEYTMVSKEKLLDLLQAFEQHALNYGDFETAKAADDFAKIVSDITPLTPYTFFS